MKKWPYGDTWKLYSDDWTEIDFLEAMSGLEPAATYAKDGKEFAKDFIIRDASLKERTFFLRAERVR